MRSVISGARRAPTSQHANRLTRFASQVGEAEPGNQGPDAQGERRRS